MQVMLGSAVMPLKQCMRLFEHGLTETALDI